MALSSGGGAWLASTASGIIGPDVDPFPWDDIISFTFDERDADGYNRGDVFNAPELQTGTALIGVMKVLEDKTVRRVGYQQTAPLVANADGTYTLAVQRTTVARRYDLDPIADINPPDDSNYDILCPVSYTHLTLPTICSV